MKSSFTCHWGINHPLHPVDTYYLLYQWTVSWFWKRSAKSAKFEWSINRKLLLFLVSGTDRYIFINTLKWSTVWCINCYMFSSASKIRQPLQQQHQRKLTSAFRGYNFFLPWLIQVGFCLPNENHPLSMLDYLTVLVLVFLVLVDSPSHATMTLTTQVLREIACVDYHEIWGHKNLQGSQ